MTGLAPRLRTNSRHEARAMTINTKDQAASPTAALRMQAELRLEGGQL